MEGLKGKESTAGQHAELTIQLNESGIGSHDCQSTKMLRGELASSNARISTLTMQLKNARKGESHFSGKEKDCADLMGELKNISEMKLAVKKQC